MRTISRRSLLFIIAGVTSTCAAADGRALDTASRRDIERGRYVVAISGCNECHTAGYLQRGERVPDHERLTGSASPWRSPRGTAYATNLRLYLQDVTEEQWMELAREIRREPPMPYYALNAMSQHDLRAVYRYIRHLGPAGEPAPAFVPDMPRSADRAASRRASSANGTQNRRSAIQGERP